MQRIDENTYIDDTLVTCAEYQLFIDEMREQGKYYQPDHWTSYQFPQGQARKPILGLRQSDAVSFCDWLTRRENEKWNYRLPKYVETQQVPFIFVGDEHFVGYWSLVEENTQSAFRKVDCDFTWIGNEAINARTLSYENFLEYYNISKVTNKLSGRQFLQGKKHLNKFKFSIKHGFQKDFDFDYIFNRTINRAVDLDFERTLHDPFIGINVTHKNILEIISRFYSRLTEIKPNNNLPRYVRYSTLDVKNNKELILKFIIDLYTLQERIAGRSPAFEGIRLVKERIR